MNRIFIAAMIASMVGGTLSASTAISCSGDATSVNSCIASHLTSFTTQLDWAMFGTADGALHTGVWTASSGGMTLDVSAPGTSGMNEGLRIADNYSRIYLNGAWVASYNTISPPAAFAGHFDAPPDLSTASTGGPGYPGDHLMGLRLDGTNSLDSMMINFSSPLTDLSFRMASLTSSTFNATVSIFSGVNGTGTLLGQLNLSGLTGGGAGCTGLNLPTPVPCNDAPWLAFLAQSGGIRSIIINSNDPTGFYISNLFESTTVPEPSPLILCGCGAGMLWIGKKRWPGRARNRTEQA